MKRIYICSEEYAIDTLRDLVNDMGTQREAARSIGISEVYLSEVLTGKRRPSEKILQ